MIKCLNCDANNGNGIEHCRFCGANLRTKKYQREDNPVSKTEKRLDRVEGFLARLTTSLEEHFNGTVQKENEVQSSADPANTGGKPKSKAGAEPAKPADPPKPKRRFPVFGED